MRFPRKRMTTRRLGLALVPLAVVALSFGRGSDPELCAPAPCPPEPASERGRRLLWSGGRELLPAALLHFEEALRREPSAPARWCDLAEAYAVGGLEDRASTCFRAAVGWGPAAPSTLLRAAQHFLSVERPDEALPLLGRVLDQTQAYNQQAFSLLDRSGVGAEEALAAVIPPQPVPLRIYYRHVLAERPEEAGLAFAWIRKAGLLDADLAADHVSGMLARGRYSEAGAAWRDWAGSPEPPGELLFNPSFERELHGGPLAWILRRHEHASVRRDSTVSAAGHSSLRVDFDGRANPNYEHVLQRTIVEPGAHRIAASMRARGLTSDQGLRLRVLDAEDSTRLDLRSQPLVGDVDWRRFERRFIVGPQTRLIEVRLERSISPRAGARLGGTVWLDDLSLRRLP